MVCDGEKGRAVGPGEVGKGKARSKRILFAKPVSMDPP